MFGSRSYFYLIIFTTYAVAVGVTFATVEHISVVITPEAERYVCQMRLIPGNVCGVVTNDVVDDERFALTDEVAVSQPTDTSAPEIDGVITVELASKRTVPYTSRLLSGVVVPIPTFPPVDANVVVPDTFNRLSWLAEPAPVAMMRPAVDVILLLTTKLPLGTLTAPVDWTLNKDEVAKADEVVVATSNKVVDDP